MARPATGSVLWTRNKRTGAMQWHVRLTLADATRPPPMPLDPSIPREDEVRARACAQDVSKLARARGLVAADKGITFEEYSRRWLAHREGRVASVSDNKGHLHEHIFPAGLRLQAMKEVSRADIEEVVAALDHKIEAGELSAKTAKNVWGTVSKLFDDATNAKPATGLREIDRDPTDGVRGPDDDGVEKALQFLYPSEVSDFLACREVPLSWRRNLAVGVYLCLRDGEQRALKWNAVDLEHGIVTIAAVFDRRAAADRDGTKSGAARQVAIPAPLLPLLAAMRKESGGTGYVCKMPSLRDMARGLRRWLLRAGVKREQLHKSSAVSRPIRWHDTRATGLTWHAVAGKPPTEIRDIAGHTQTTMTDRYVRAATVVRGGRFGEPFPALPECLSDRAAGFGESFGFHRNPVSQVAAFLAENSGADGTRRIGSKSVLAIPRWITRFGHPYMALPA